MPGVKQEIQITPNDFGLFDLTHVGFGQVTMDTSTPPAPTQAYFNELGYPDQPQSALLATDFPGLGLPYYLWYQLANLLYKVDASFDLELNCHDQVGGICSLN